MFYWIKSKPFRNLSKSNVKVCMWRLWLHLLCASIIKFISNLAGHAWTTTESTHSIFSSASINSIPFTGFASKQKYWNARNTTGQKTIQETGFPKSVGIFPHLTWKATISTATYEKHYVIRKRIFDNSLMNVSYNLKCH